MPDQFHPKTRAEWREWLAANHASASGVWAISYKKAANKPIVSYDELVEEALCFGWIDSLTKKRDAESYYRTFSPRKPKSNWSKPNMERAERMIEKGLMTEHGQKLIDIAKNTVTWKTIEAK